MVRIRTLAAVAVVICLVSGRSLPGAVNEYIWNPALTGTQSWTTDGNWNQAGYPNGPTDTANVSVPLAGDLSLRLGGYTRTVAGLAMGGTDQAVTTTVGDGRLTLQNNDSTFNNGNVLITSGGVPGATNTIAAHLFLDNERVEFGPTSTNDITVYGNIVYAGNSSSSLRSFMPAGLKATITGSIYLEDAANPSTYSYFGLNDNPGSPEGQSGVSTQGTLELAGSIGGWGRLNIGITNSSQPLPLGTVILSGDNWFDGGTNLNRANLVLASDYALGYSYFHVGNPNRAIGFNLISDSDDRTIGNVLELSQWLSIKGEHSLTWSGLVVQTNSRGWVNLLPSGKTLTLGNAQFAIVGDDVERTYGFDGTGKTVVLGGLHDKFSWDTYSQVNDGSIGHLHKTGTGTVVVSGYISDYHGDTIIEAGNLHFSTGNHLVNSSSIVSTGGAIGIDDPASPTFSNATLLGKLDTADTGGLMLTPSEAGATLDFTTGLLAGAANMSVAAPEDGLTFTGTITPATDTYLLGGGTGTLTLPNTNQLTGANNLVALNGGEVQLTGVNDYTGTTTVMSTTFESRTNQAIADTTYDISTTMTAGTTLTVTTLADGGVNSGIGSSSSAATNLIVSGGTLKYVGPAASTDRLFAIGMQGATLDASGSGPLLWTNPGALATAASAAQDRTLTLTGTNTDHNTLAPLVSDDTDGSVVSLTKAGTGTWVLAGDNTYSGTTGVEAGTLLVEGTHTGTGQWTVAAGATLGGNGSIGGDVAVDGTLAPGTSVGALDIAGQITLGAESTLAIEIGGTAFGQFDRLTVGGAAQLGGTLQVDLVDLGGGEFVPTLGDQFAILSVIGGAGGTFDQFDLPTLAPGLAWQLAPGDVTVFLNVVALLAGDYNDDGIVDAADYTVWRDTLGSTTDLRADGNGNDEIDEADYAVWKANYGQTSGSGALTLVGSVPEPSSLALACWALLGVAAARRLAAGHHASRPH